MRIVQLTPGTGTFFCGSCLRDDALVRQLRARGHEAIMVPLYLPLVTDGEDSTEGTPIQVGGIRLYLQQKFPRLWWFIDFFRPFLDNPARLARAARHMGMTSARDLGEMTRGSLRGESGHQSHAWGELVDFIREEKPDLISLSNGLLCGMVPIIERDLGIPVICSLQGEDAFLDALPEPYRTECWDVLRELAPQVSQFVAASEFYASGMRTRLGLEKGRIAVVPNGMDFSEYPARVELPDPPVIGFLARLIKDKGLDQIVDAFIELHRRGEVPEDTRLHLAGTVMSSDEKFIEVQRMKIEEAGLEDHFEVRRNLSFAEKTEFLGELSVLSVPATYGEAFGLYVIEALAVGVPVVQPEHGGFPEILARTDGGLLVEADSTKALAEGLEALLCDPDRALELGLRGRQETLAYYSAERMAEDFEKICADSLKSVKAFTENPI